MPAARLRVYLGVAPGVGCTHALLDEGRRRRARGTDVVVASLEARHETAAGDLPRVGDGERLDADAVLARRPQVALVDDLAAVDPSGKARWQGVEQLLAAGVDVVATMDVTAIASLGDVVGDITGAPPASTVPDRVLLGADQVELVDMTPQALRRRLAHGGLYAADELDAVRAARFAPATLARLRELALTWMGALVRRSGKAAHGPETAERLLVALSGSPDDAGVLRRAVRLSHRLGGAELTAVHVVQASSRSSVGAGDPARTAAAAGVAYQEVIGDDVARALLDFARAQHATQLLVGGGRRGALTRSLIGAGTVPVLVLPDAPGPVAPALRRQGPAALSSLRRWAGYVGAVALPGVATLALLAAGGWLGLAGVSLVFIAAVVVVALVGGLGPAVLAAVVSSTALNYFFIPPLRTLQIGEPHNVLTLGLFAVIAVAVGTVVHRAATQAARATRAAAEARMLSRVAEDTVLGKDALAILLEQIRAAFGLRAVSLLRHDEDGWETLASTGLDPAASPEAADVRVEAGPDLVLALDGRTLSASDRAVLTPIAAQVRGVLERDRLERAARQAARLEATERLRDALLVALGHDLRTPLATARAAVDSLRAPDVELSRPERDELLTSAGQSLDRLSRLVADVLDLSRLRAGSLALHTEPVWLDDLIAPALDEVGVPAGLVQVQLPDDLPPVTADPALLLRAVVNLVGNAVRHAPGSALLVSCSATRTRVEIRVVDHGPGVSADDAARIFTPFQRLGDTDGGGLGLGLALSQGLVEAMDGTLTPEETPGGGLTMVISLPVAPVAEEPPLPGRRERSEAP